MAEIKRPSLVKTAVPEEVIATFSPRVTARQAESRRKRIVKAAPSVLYSLEMITRARKLDCLLVESQVPSLAI